MSPLLGRMPRWRVLWVVVLADVRQLLRQKSTSWVGLVLLSSGVMLGFSSARFDPADWIPLMKASETSSVEAPETLALCTPERMPVVGMDGALPGIFEWSGTVVAADDPRAEVWLEWLDATPAQQVGDGALLYGRGPAGDSDAVDAVLDCLRYQISDERDRRLESLGIRAREHHVLRLRRHKPPKKEADDALIRKRWFSDELPRGLDLFEVMVAILSMLFSSGQVVDGVLRNRTSGWEETLGTAGLTGQERVLARMGASALLGFVVMGILVVGGVLVSPVAGFWVHPVRLMAAMVTPLAAGAVLVAVTNGAVDVRAATARVVFPLAMLVYGVAGGLIFDIVWLPFGGPLVLAVFGGSPTDWVLGLGTTMVVWALVVAGTLVGVADVQTNHGDRRSAGARHAAGRFGPEAFLLAGLGAWCLLVLPLIAGQELVAAHLMGQVVGLGGVALVAPVALGLPVKRTLGVGATRLQSFAGAALLPLGTVPLALGLLQLQATWMPVPDGGGELVKSVSEQLGQLSEPLGGVLLWGIPAVFEELFFRGALLGLLLPWGPWPRRNVRVVFAVVMQALAFGLLHLPPERWLATGALGLVFGAVAVRSRSIWPGMVAHALHNFVVLQLAGQELPELLGAGAWLWLLGLVVVPLVWVCGPAEGK